MSQTFHFREVTGVTKEVSCNHSDSLLLFSQQFCLFKEKAVCPFYFLFIYTVWKVLAEELVGICLVLQLLGEFGSSRSLEQNFFNWGALSHCSQGRHQCSRRRSFGKGQPCALCYAHAAQSLLHNACQVATAGLVSEWQITCNDR